MNTTEIKLYDNQIEQACLGSALISQQAQLYLFDQTKAEDYYFEKNRILFTVMHELYNDKQGIDILIVKDKLSQKGIDKITDSDLMEIYRAVGSSANIQYYIDRLLEFSKQRKLDYINMEIKDDLKSQKDSNDIIQDTIYKLKAIDRERGKVIYPVESILGKDIQDLAIKDYEYVKTGILQLDKLIFGLFNSTLTCVAARPGMGKSSLALNMAVSIAVKSKVLFFSLEMSVRFLALRLISAECHIPLHHLMQNILDKYQVEAIRKQEERIRKLNLGFNDQGGLTVENIVNMTLRAAEYEKPAIVFVDYAGIVKPTDKKLPRHEQIGHISWSLRQNLAKELNIPVVLLAQLNRSVENRTKGVPRLSDLKESGSLEEDSDMVIFIYEEIERSGDCELIVAKNRNGAAGHEKIYFDRQYTKFI
jgi:replicative DNA helicase